LERVDPPVAAVGKLGLALSGGGHRAAFFHIGALARLAELGRLRGVEVISTVSGGSIVGALYYLHVKRLLETKPDSEITDEDYLELVRRVEAQYRDAMAKNLRGSALADYFQNWRLVSPSFSRTDRIGEKLEEDYYRPAFPGSGPIDMSELKITPLGDDGKPLADFDPTKGGNVGRRAPVPILLLNATTLNTGHNWRFEATWIGEPGLDTVEAGDVDKNIRLLQWRSALLPPAHRKRSLGSAVASSACFPGGLAPVVIKGLYVNETSTGPDPFTVKLTDGGVRDNQGIDALLDYDCGRLIVSDGSGQFGTSANPGARLPALLPRVASIEGKESREQRILRTSAKVQGRVAFFHLLTGVEAATLKPEGAEPIPGYPPDPAPSPYPPTEIDDDAQKTIAKMRTDLDAFSDLEAETVMETGYRATKAVLEARPPTILDGAAPIGDRDWDFHRVGTLLEQPSEEYRRHLRIAKQRFFKPLLYRLDPLGLAFRKAVPRPVRNVLGIAAGLAILGGLVYAGFAIGDAAVSGDVVYAVAVGLVVVAALYVWSELPGLRTASNLFFDVVLTAVGALLPLWLFGLAQIWSGKAHRRQGPAP
jgi:NTE family protein